MAGGRGLGIRAYAYRHRAVGVCPSTAYQNLEISSISVSMSLQRGSVGAHRHNCIATIITRPYLERICNDENKTMLLPHRPHLAGWPGGILLGFSAAERQQLWPSWTRGHQEAQGTVQRHCHALYGPNQEGAVGEGCNRGDY